MDPVNVPAKSEVRNFTRLCDNSDWSIGWGLPTSILQEALGVGDGTVRKSVGEFL